RCGGTEPDIVDPAGTDDLPHRMRGGGGGQHDDAGPADHFIVQGGIEGGGCRSILGGGEHGDQIRVLGGQKVTDIGLDSTDRGRKVIGDNKGSSSAAGSHGRPPDRCRVLV